MEGTQIVTDSLGRIQQTIRRVLNGLPEESLHYRPTPDANPICWLIWHLTRVQDHHMSDLLGKEQLWTAGGWHAKFGLPADIANTGTRHTKEDVETVRADAETLQGYYDAVYERSKEVLGSLSAERPRQGDRRTPVQPAAHHRRAPRQHHQRQHAARRPGHVRPRPHSGPRMGRDAVAACSRSTKSATSSALTPAALTAFGWSICEVFDDIVLPARGGAAGHVAEVMDKVVNYIHREAQILGIGIASPLFWSPTGTRRVDAIVREALAARGHPAPEQAVGGLGETRGERLVQGHLLAADISHHFDAPITEVNPKALLWLLDPEVKRDQDLAEGTPDAVVAAFAAWCMRTAAAGWKDIYPQEPNPVLPLGTPVSYWMPI